MRGRLRKGASAWGGKGGLGAERANLEVGSGCLVRGRLRRGGKCLGFGVWSVRWTRWSRGRVDDLRSGLRLLGVRAFERGGGKCLGFGVWTVEWTRWSRGRVGDLGSGLRLLGARAFEKGGQVLGVDRVVSGLRGRIGEWAQAAWGERV